VLGEDVPATRHMLEITIGGAVIVFSVASFFKQTRWAHLLTGAAAVFIGATAYLFAPRPGPPMAQNAITVALFLLMTCIIPNEASRPPHPWRRPRQGA
jgi:hypothetical protein